MTGVRFRVLGALRVLNSAETPVPIGGAKPRMLLATLLLNANRPVPVDTLVDVLWPHDPPPSAVANLRTYVSALRSRLHDERDSAEAIQARPPGYLAVVRPWQLDLLGFDELLARARYLRERDHPEEALEALNRANALWQGAPLEDLTPSPRWEAELSRLNEARLSATEERIDLRITTGRYGTAIAELRGLIHEQPFREGLWQQLMLALHGSGRRAEALDTYTDLRRRLVDELGVEPGPSLRRLHTEILTGGLPEEAVTAESGRTAHRQDAFPIHQLPPDVSDFTGRDRFVHELSELLTRSEGSGPAIATVVGSPGVGKSTCAVHVAHAVRDSFPDGQLYLELAGTSEEPNDPADLLAEALRALGASDVPGSVSERARLYRSLLADRRVLVVLDDALGAGQVGPLLPSTGAVLITSRWQLTELAGARHRELDVLGSREARSLLANIAGEQRVTAEPQHASAILRSCGYLPLAIRIAGAKLAGRRAWSLRVLSERLEDRSRRLEELRLRDLHVRASFELSYRQLTAETARAFRLLGLLWSQPVPGWVLGALLERGHADDVLDALVDANLLRLVGTDSIAQPRYQLHGLLYCYARELLADDPERERRAALARVMDGWLTLADRAIGDLEARASGTSAASHRHPPEDVVNDLVADPLAWFDAERQALAATVTIAAESGLDELSRGLDTALSTYFDLRGRHESWNSRHRAAWQSGHHTRYRAFDLRVVRSGPN
ncbi:DNA-binding SARP family transcriptional activator [Saccharopolyspora lacisalsi]|uniref:DNA-binding SARP family transcriptional activator n=1 Tax=Halosaccharopolyspora lacisalsi TaxID=1000566 RepID=A0A839DXC9_9PSEU|nr:BTAD domain-containing putative transcriptional regulator [Halosaccharopolyspora lacisalsi]MBA8826622.1 DNA-binding SARP family transcriptional activator [Halosaccharopolyspora lacisalsi]